MRRTNKSSAHSEHPADHRDVSVAHRDVFLVYRCNYCRCEISSVCMKIPWNLYVKQNQIQKSPFIQVAVGWRSFRLSFISVIWRNPQSKVQQSVKAAWVLCSLLVMFQSYNTSSQYWLTVQQCLYLSYSLPLSIGPEPALVEAVGAIFLAAKASTVHHW